MGTITRGRIVAAHDGAKGQFRRQGEGVHKINSAGGKEQGCKESRNTTNGASLKV
ncbi:hypothetical protein FACS189483_06980 [Spirochaetia bacterium]|nr:hypothetical protein FACS189483_06980 [Spirochaetia bacterium]